MEIDQITIAAVNGYCLGGAACIASACDFRIASEDAILGYPEINLGINLNWLGLPLAVRLIGPSRAKKMVIGGENEDAETLLSWGFYDEVCPSNILMDKAKDMALLYASKSPIAAQMIKRSVNNLVYKNDESIMHMDYDQTLLTHETKDRKRPLQLFSKKENLSLKRLTVDLTSRAFLPPHIHPPMHQPHPSLRAHHVNYLFLVQNPYIFPSFLLIILPSLSYQNSYHFYQHRKIIGI